ncbi:RES domain-containing protein [Pseudomonas sp. GM74]|uniref:RES family NAD+ phosphorylase n=1 Tax=Pseudomonas sp. GM74 TaxID=1144336 RepID=UPI000270ABC0|nr:RES family NAD+ phosphorylase [Pseudomonas sp. GM74]EJM84676.1 RES domain-containing protein [Pseudomonas sp. GM74]
MAGIEETICFECIGDQYLREKIIASGISAECLNCGKNLPSMELDTLANEVDRILRETVEEGDLVDVYDPESDRISHTEQHGDPLSFFVAEILVLDDDDPVVRSVLDKLTCNSPSDLGFFDGENYSRRETIPFMVPLNWIEFESELRHRSRFFNQKAKDFLFWLFDGIDDYYVWGFGPGVVRQMSPTECEPIYRARNCTPPKDDSAAILANPGVQLSSPPKEIAPAGRMSPAGIPVFNGAFERDTCIAELRPPVGGKVISGEFKLTRDIRALDFTKLEEAYDSKLVSYFDPDYWQKIERRLFLRSFHEIISRPVVPDYEHEYLKTQVIAEYLATQHTPNFDGVIFSSAQHEGGRNIVLFSHVVSPDPLPPVADENGWYPIEAVPGEPGVEFVPESLVVHSIERVKFSTKDNRVIDGQMERDIDDFFDREF